MAVNDVVHIENLNITLPTFRGPLPVVRHMHLRMAPGEIVGLLGESGAGKSVTASSLLGLLPVGAVTADTFQVLGQSVLSYTEAQWRPLRQHGVAMIYQDPMTALNPILSIGTQMKEVIRDKGHAKEIAIEWLRHMGIPSPEKRYNQYPHELSGGMRQRVVIAMALASEPSLIIADEPTTALDVTTEAQILQLLQTYAKEQEVSVLFISHNLRIVAQLCHTVMVMYGGTCVEEGPVTAIFNHPCHPYTQGLLASLPQGKARGQLQAIPGMPPDMYALPKGCAFHPRCPEAMNICASKVPLVQAQGDTQFSCWLPERGDM